MILENGKSKCCEGDGNKIWAMIIDIVLKLVK